MDNLAKKMDVLAKITVVGPLAWIVGGHFSTKVIDGGVGFSCQHPLRMV